MFKANDGRNTAKDAAEIPEKQKQSNSRKLLIELSKLKHPDSRELARNFAAIRQRRDIALQIKREYQYFRKSQEKKSNKTISPDISRTELASSVFSRDHLSQANISSLNVIMQVPSQRSEKSSKRTVLQVSARNSKDRNQSNVIPAGDQPEPSPSDVALDVGEQ